MAVFLPTVSDSCWVYEYVPADNPAKAIFLPNERIDHNINLIFKRWLLLLLSDFERWLAEIRWIRQEIVFHSSFSIGVIVIIKIVLVNCVLQWYCCSQTTAWFRKPLLLFPLEPSKPASGSLAPIVKGPPARLLRPPLKFQHITKMKNLLCWYCCPCSTDNWRAPLKNSHWSRPSYRSFVPACCFPNAHLFSYLLSVSG